MRRLILRPGATGDCILSFPALEYLKAEYTEVWAPSAVLPLMRFADSTHSLVGAGVDLLAVGDLEPSNHLRDRLQSFDSIVSWYGANRAEFRQALLSLNPNCKFHAALPGDSSLHATDFYAAQVGAPLGLIPHIHVVAPDKRNTIVIHPFSGSRKKNWPLDSYRQLAAQLPLKVDWLAGPEEELPEAHRFDNLADVAVFIAGARLYIGNDSGITHLAAAAGVKTLALFGPASARIWAPRGDNVRVLAVENLNDLDARTVAAEAIGGP